MNTTNENRKPSGPLILCGMIILVLAFACGFFLNRTMQTPTPSGQEITEPADPSPEPNPEPTIILPSLSEGGGAAAPEGAGSAPSISDGANTASDSASHHPATEAAETPDTSGSYQGWPAIPANQLPQPDAPADGTQIVIPTNSSIGTYNGNTVIVVPNQTSSERGTLDWIAEEIFLLTNQEREKAGLKKLSYAYDLQDAADTRAQEASVLFSHTRPNGQSCHDIVTKNCNVTGENLIQADRPVATPANLVAEWMSSPGHRANILLKDYTELVVGVYEKNGVVYACQIFVG